jgi:hypothetical protein
MFDCNFEGAAKMTETRLTVEEWLAIRKQAALRIDPETAQFRWGWAYVADPYGVDPNLPEEYRCIGRVYFARSPGSDVWVSFDDLTDDVLEQCRKKMDESSSDWPSLNWLREVDLF